MGHELSSPGDQSRAVKNGLEEPGLDLGRLWRGDVINGMGPQSFLQASGCRDAGEVGGQWSGCGCWNQSFLAGQGILLEDRTRRCGAMGGTGTPPVPKSAGPLNSH